MSDNFAFLLPVMMFTFGGAFLIVWRSGARPALLWGAGYLLCGTAFCCPAVLAGLPDSVQATFADALFAIGFLCYRQALLLRFARPPSWATGIGMATAAAVASAVAVLDLGSLRLEISSNDAVCAALAGSALLSIRRSIRQPVDRALFGVTAIVVLDNMLHGATAIFTTATDDPASYMESNYAFLTQASAAIFGLVFGLTALAALCLDIVAKYRTEALTDPLTGLWNRRGFETATPDLARVAAPQGTVLTCDIDHFKRVNDTLGHAMGDKVIVTVAELLTSGLPPGAVVSRFGGEEFIVYLPTGDGESRLLADQLRRAIAEHVWEDTGVDWPLTASFGLAEVEPHDASLHDAITRADRSLYEAKMAGRNMVASRSLAA